MCLHKRKEEEEEYERIRQRAIFLQENGADDDQEMYDVDVEREGEGDDSDANYDDDKSSLSESDFDDTEDYGDEDAASASHPLIVPNIFDVPPADDPMDITLDTHEHDHPYDSPRPPSPVSPSARSSLSLSPSQVPSTSLLQPETDPPPNTTLSLPPDVLASFQEAFEWNDKETQLLDWECTGFQDLIVTGEVGFFFSFL